MSMSDARTVIVGAITAAAVVVFVSVLGKALFYTSEPELFLREFEMRAPARDTASTDLPARLRIPSVGIDAHVQHVGVARSGNMAVPTNYSDVGWYRYGTVPGFVGSAVIDGHVDNGLSLAGVFDKLGEVKEGDEIYIHTAGTTTLRFVVREIASYDYREVPLERLFLRADKARLNLITCDGAWIAGEKTYDRRLVVYAELG